MPFLRDIVSKPRVMATAQFTVDIVITVFRVLFRFTYGPEYHAARLYIYIMYSGQMAPPVFGSFV